MVDTGFNVCTNDDCIYDFSFQQEDWDFLQLQVALLYNSETSGIPLHMMVNITKYTEILIGI